MTSKIPFPWFAFLVLASAFLIELIGSYVSVLGIMALFAADPIVIALAISLDIAKVTVTTLLYKYWARLGWLMKSYMTVACMVLMLITSVGVFGFLSGKFQSSISHNNQQQIVIESMQGELDSLIVRKREIDSQIANLPDNTVKGRQALMKTFGPELERVNGRISELTQEIPKVKVETLKQSTELGPILYIAKAFSITPEEAVKYVILVIVGVFDPLAISLLVSGTFLIKNHKRFVYEDMIEDKKYENIETTVDKNEKIDEANIVSNDRTSIDFTNRSNDIDLVSPEYKVNVVSEEQPEKDTNVLIKLDAYKEDEPYTLANSSLISDVDVSYEHMLNLKPAEHRSNHGGISARDVDVGQRDTVTLDMLKKH